ncbi:hypothetical protein [Scytonema sp. NUACC26]|uniref:hypothetical protein n=1 Tax=Scytonema sp. NUACC26 TaxID=3140176 RepID=UPI0034DC040B
MKPITLPKSLLKLPYPWHISSGTQRRQQIEKLSYSPDESETSLEVLEQCLHTLSQFKLPSEDSIPESLMQYWDFSAEWLAQSMPTLGDFDLAKVEERLKEYEMASPTVAMVEDVGEYWLWWVLKDIVSTILKWLEDVFRKAKNVVPISRLIDITLRYLQQVEPHIAQSLLSCTAVIGWNEALPLLECVERNTSISSSVIDSARGYRQWILGSKSSALLG